MINLMLFHLSRKLCNSAILAGVFLFFLTLYPSYVFANDLTITPKILERVTWNDNLFLEDISDTELRSDPQIETNYKNERLSIDLNGRLTDFRYLDESEYNRTTYNANFALNYLFSERATLGFGGSWSKDYSVDSFWDVNTNNANILFRKRDRYNAFANSSIQITERDSVDVSGGYSSMRYDERTPGYSDYDAYSANITWRHMLNDNTLALISRAAWQHITFDSPERAVLFGHRKDDIKQDVYNGLLGLYWVPTEQLTIQAMAGVNHTRSHVEVEQTGLFAQESESKYNKNGFTGNVDVSWRDEYSSLKFSINQEYMPSTFGEIRTVTNGLLTGTHRFSDKFRSTAEVGYTLSETENVSTNTDISREYWRFNTGGVYSLTEDLAMRINYAHIRYHNKVTDKRKNSNAIFLQFTYKFPMNF